MKPQETTAPPLRGHWAGGQLARLGICLWNRPGKLRGERGFQGSVEGNAQRSRWGTAGANRGSGPQEGRNLESSGTDSPTVRCPNPCCSCRGRRLHRTRSLPPAAAGRLSPGLGARPRPAKGPAHSKLCHAPYTLPRPRTLGALARPPESKNPLQGGGPQRAPRPFLKECAPPDATGHCGHPVASGLRKLLSLEL